MLDADYWSHTSPSGKEPWDFMEETGYTWVYAGENLAKGFTSSQEVLDAWKESTAHKENLLNPNYTETGVAVIPGKIKDKRLVLVVQFFASPSHKEGSSDLRKEFEGVQTKSLEDTTKLPVSKASPEGGIFEGSVTIDLESSEGTNIYYTLNGKDPDFSSHLYREPLTLKSSRILKFFAVDQTGNQEEIQVEKYIIRRQPKNNPVLIKPSDGSYLNNSEIEIKGRAYVESEVILKLNEESLETITTDKESPHAFSFTTNLEDGVYQLSVELTQSKLSSATVSFMVDTTAPLIKLSEMELNAGDNSYYLEIPIEGANKAQLIIEERRVDLNLLENGNFAGEFSLGPKENIVKIYAEDLARNTSSTSFEVSGNLGETLGVVKYNEEKLREDLIISQSFRSGLKTVSIAILLLLTVFLALSAILSQLRGLKYKSTHSAVHASITGVLALVLIFLL